jgi:hypothetical protein
LTLKQRLLSWLSGNQTKLFKATPIEIYEKKPSNTTKVICYMLQKATSFDPAVGSSSGVNQEIDEKKCT